jgi:xanthine dehydrogenase accessory factor
MKVGDVDPRARREHCFTVSDKSRAIAGGVLEAILMLAH